MQELKYLNIERANLDIESQNLYIESPNLDIERANLDIKINSKDIIAIINESKYTPKIKKSLIKIFINLLILFLGVVT